MKKRILIFGGIALSILILGGAAYVGGWLLNGQPFPWGGPSLIPGNGPGEVRINVDDIQPAKELPQTPATGRGIFDRRQNNSIFVGTGNISIGVQRDQSGNVETSAEHDGPIVEVVVNSQTIVYKDVTMQRFPGQPPAGQKIQQVVEPGSLDDIGETSTVTVWGRKTGDRIIAEVLVYTPPGFIE